MHRFGLASLGSLFLGCTLAAHANTITAGTYVLENASVAGYAVTGTVTVNSAGTATSANLTVNAPAFDNPGLPTFVTTTVTAAYAGMSQNYLLSPTGAGQMALIFNTVADANGNFDLCLAATQCGTSAGTIAPSALQIYSFYSASTRATIAGLSPTAFTGGDLRAANATPTAATPEPSTLVLLGTGLFGMSGAAVRRRRRETAGGGLPVYA